MFRLHDSPSRFPPFKGLHQLTRLRRSFPAQSTSPSTMGTRRQPSWSGCGGSTGIKIMCGLCRGRDLNEGAPVIAVAMAGIQAERAARYHCDHSDFGLSLVACLKTVFGVVIAGSTRATAT